MDGKLGYLYSIWIFNALASSRPTVIKIHCCFIIVQNSQNSTSWCFHICVWACLPSDSAGFILCLCIHTYLFMKLNKGIFWALDTDDGNNWSLCWYVRSKSFPSAVINDNIGNIKQYSSEFPTVTRFHIDLDPSFAACNKVYLWNIYERREGEGGTFAHFKGHQMHPFSSNLT